MEANTFYRNLYDLFADWSFWGVSPIPDWLAYFLAGFLIVFAVINIVVIVTTIGTWAERRLIGRFQSRLGPNRWGPWGLFTPIADAVKLLSKEDTRPEQLFQRKTFVIGIGRLDINKLRRRVRLNLFHKFLKAEALPFCFGGPAFHAFEP